MEQSSSWNYDEMEVRDERQLRIFHHTNRGKENDYDQEAIKYFLACNQDAKTREKGAIKYSLLMLILKKNI